MSLIHLKDNSIKSFFLSDCKGDCKNLRMIANKTIGELQKESEILVFPLSVEKTDDKIKDSVIFNMKENEEKCSLETENIMGFAGCGDTQIEITSRFTENENAEDFFLHYMLAKVFALNLFELKHLSGDGLFDFLIYLFPYFLQKALSQGMFRTYRFFSRNDADIKGAPDVSRHIKQNVPFAGRIAYNSRERSFDNDITQLVRHTIEAIKIRPNEKAVFSKNEEIRRSIAQIVQATPTYNAQDRNKIIAQNAKPLAHPFFTHWRLLQKVSLAILHNQKLKYGKTKNQIYGILFDGAWLWEEYLATVLKEKGYVHPENKNKSGGFSPFVKSNVGRFYPDFYKPKQSENSKKCLADEILDAKYKNFDQKNPQADDLAQMIAYIHVMDARAGFFIYPSKDKKEIGNAPWTLKPFANQTAKIGTRPFFIPQNVKDCIDFKEQMTKSEKELVDGLDAN